MNAFHQQAQDGTVLIADTMRELVYFYARDLFDLLDFEDDRAFMEPLLFAYFNSDRKTIGLSQVLWGYIPDPNKPRLTPVTANDEGVIYLPNFGYLIGPPGVKHLMLAFDVSSVRVDLHDSNGNLLPHVFRPAQKILNSRVEVVTSKCDLLDTLFLDEEGHVVPVEGISDPGRVMPNIQRAISTITTANKEFLDCFDSCVRSFYLFRGTPNSFATIRAHGMAFFNLDGGESTIYFLDNIIHQCAHVIFNAISFEKARFFNIDPETRLSQITGDLQDRSSVYGRFHGLFTQTNINLTMDRCIDLELFESVDLHELLGRLSSNLKRFGVALQKLNRPELYSDVGAQWYEYFSGTHAKLISKRKNVLESLNTDNQPYVFDYKLFAETNPLSSDTSVLRAPL